MKECLLVLIFVIAVTGSFINPYPRFKEYVEDCDPGEPLFLTDLIKSGKIDEAKQKAAVVEGQFDWLESYSGYLTVNEQYNSNMFFWYFKPEVNTNNAPVILWLQGGPGATSLFGLFAENGPFSVDKNGKLIKREFRWSQNHHLIYIDNPVGTGFSFTKDDAGYAKNEKDVGKDLYEALSQIFTLFPVLQVQDFWITGESYAGKYVPAIAYKIHLENKKAIRKGKNNVPMKLKGIAIGNGLSDPLHQLKYGDYLYQLGLIDANGLRIFHDYEEKGVNCIKKHDMDCAFDAFDELINMDQTKDGSVFYNLTGFKTYFNYLKPKGDDNGKYMGDFVQSCETRKAIHVGNMSFNDLEGENKVELHLKKDVMDSVALWIANLLEGYRVCVYNGQLDIIVAYPLTENYLQALKFNGSDIYRSAPRYIWRIDDEIAGYVKEANHLIEILVRNAGHMAPADQPKWIFDMITRLTHGKSFNSL